MRKKLISVIMIFAMAMALAPKGAMAEVTAAPPEVSAATVSHSQISISWQAVENSQGYEIYRYNSVTGKYEIIRSVRGETLCFIDSGLKINKTYKYYVNALLLAEDGTTIIKSGISRICSAKTIPAAPINVKYSVTSRKHIKITWKKVSGVSGYYVYRASKGGKYKKIKTITKAGTTSFSNSSITANKTYAYKIKAYKKSGKKKISGRSSASIDANNGMAYKKKLKVKAYAYTGKGTCANGKKARIGRIAVDKKVIPLSTWLYVPGYGLCQACDTGVKGKKIDVYLSSEKECRKWGIKKKTVYIIGKKLPLV
ncbi:MAG TPA: 3D domain-containing protein [Bacillota bacterium]|nr:3D domain-containing protein [Bacillota bacterium]HUM55728.1 3D domain-containing protein [Bacillota bacterium]